SKRTPISLTNDYFLLYHGTHIKLENTLSIDEKIDDETFFEFTALFLSLNRNTYEAIVSLKSFQSLLAQFTLEKIENLQSLYQLQNTLIKHFLEYRAHNTVHYFHEALHYLQKEGLLDQLSLEKLLSLFDPSSFHGKNEQESSIEPIDGNFHTLKERLLESIEALKPLVNHPDELETIIEYLTTQKFSIGITGVMNAGKSTMLNALMGEALLGSSVVPETANLTLVKYRHEALAKVVYWNQSEWQHIKHSAKNIDAMAKFITQTEQHFKEELEHYISPESREDTIKIEALSHYTSANASDKKSNLVKYVELYSPLHFLQEDIEIVDTPGLDDVVIQREALTKEYLSQCDVMLHLMHVSQSATLKDIEFIIDAILYQNITKLLIVITHIDSVDYKEIEEVIAYTKQSIAAKLHEHNSDAKLDYILKTLHFIALSGKIALLYKTGQIEEAQASGYTLEQTGILEVESYLQETLFGKKNARSALIIQSAKKRLNRALHVSLEALRFESSLLYKNESEVSKELQVLKSNRSQKLDTLERLKYQISSYKDEATHYLERLDNFLDNELRSLQGIIKKRLMDETLYALEKNKKTPLLKDQSRIIETAMKDGLIDIIREYRYKFIKKSSKISEIIAQEYDELEKSDASFYSNFNHESVFGDAFKQGFVTANNTTLINRVSKVLQRASLAKLAKVDEEISAIIKEEFLYLETPIKNRAQDLSQNLLEAFFQSLEAPLKSFKNALDHNETLLQNHAQFLKEDESTRHKKSLELYERIKKIEHIAKRCQL
ncbi:MAG: dynamin family protein, partial [Campylobacterota bacterium]|nr:dynamin family protein [Campylobacterota bacterium]